MDCPYCRKSDHDEEALLACRDLYYGGSAGLRAEPKLRVVLSLRACTILELTDNRDDYMASLGIVLHAKGRSQMVVEAPHDALVRLANEFDDRDDDGWDQPASWRVSARKAALAIRAVL